jgi:AcrR family transcriptional regulator
MSGAGDSLARRRRAGYGYLNGRSGNSVSPRPTNAHLRRPAILSAAAEVISERGVQGTRISDVAERAGTSAPGVLYWFPTKDELLAEALVFSDDRYYEGLTAELEGLESATARLARLIDHWPAEGDIESILWMELWVRALRDPRLAQTRERLDRRWRAAIADIIREGQASGEFTAADADDVALLLTAVMDGFAIQLALGDPAVSAETVRRHCLGLAEAQLRMRGEVDEGSVERAAPAP